MGYDGITISDCQTGQIDIGRFSLDNVDRLSLSNGQSDNIFQPARFFASAGILNIQTLTPQFKDNRRTNLSASFKTGSWGLVNPSLLIEQKLSRKWVLSANGEWMSADGHYPFTLHYGENNDLSSREKRKNTEVKNLRAEAGLFGNFSDTEQWRLKAYYYQSSRGLPNATTYYYDYSSQHLWDKNVFVQSQYKKEFNRQWVFQTSAKWNWSYQRYLDPDYKGSEGKTENSYYQQEYYLSASALYRMLSNLSFSLDGWEHQPAEREPERFRISYPLFVVDGLCRKIRQRLVDRFGLGTGNGHQRGGALRQRRSQPTETLSVRQRVVQALCRRRVPHPPVL